MKTWIIATATAAALVAGVGAASAQTMQNDGPSYRGRMIDRNVSMQDDGAWTPSRTWRRGMTGSTYNSRAFQSQEVWPQSPPSGS